MSDQSQQWPVLPGNTSAPADSFVNPTESKGFYLLIEESINSGESTRWALARGGVVPVAGSRQDARVVALDKARTFDPVHPMMEQSRYVYRITDDEYLVIVEGMTSIYHFRISVGELL